MTQDQIAWAFRSLMVVTSAVVAYLLVQTDLELTPVTKVILGAISVGLAALNPVTVATRLVGPTDET